MPNSYKNRRAREKPIAHHRAAIKRLVDKICAETQRSAEDHQHLVHEALCLADPWAVLGRDALLPAQRHDLLEIWLRISVTTPDMSEQDRLHIALTLAPGPDESWETSAGPGGTPGYRQVTDAYLSVRRRRGRAPHEPTLAPRGSTARGTPTRGRPVPGGPDQQSDTSGDGSHDLRMQARKRPGDGSNAPQEPEEVDHRQP